MAYCNLLVVIAAVVLLVAVGSEASRGIGFNLHHRFSPVVRQWMEARGHAPGSSWLPEDVPKGSREYYSALLRHDRALLATRRSLANAGGQSTLIFADGNATRRLDYHAFLYYAEVEVGTPSSKFLVALDTGSNLFWLPCECKQYSPETGNTTDIEWSSYSPSQSSTSKTVPCDHPLCEDPCAAGTGNTNSCPYNVSYVSDNTNSLGVLVEDVLHLTGGGGESVEAPIVFGCGHVQTGLFLQGGAEGGLMGLGRGNVSVPNALASSGLVASDSFSMCFSRDGAGRINFGDAGSPDQAETPFIAPGTLQSSTLYSISVAAISVDGKAMPVEFTAVVDSGSSFTYLTDLAYTLLTAKFNSGISELRASYRDVFPDFEYCYSLSPGQTKVKRLPEVSLTTKGGAMFPITWPIVPVPSAGGPEDPRIMGYCLGVIKRSISIGDSSIDNTIGENFMTGLKVVFDRKRSVLGWEKFDCYKDAKMQDGGSPGTSLGSPADDSAPGSSGGGTAPVWIPYYAPSVPLPSGNNATDGPYPDDGGAVPLPVPASSGSGLGSRAFGGLSSILLSVLLVAFLA